MPSTIGVAEAATRSLATITSTPIPSLEVKCIVPLGIGRANAPVLVERSARACRLLQSLSNALQEPVEGLELGGSGSVVWCRRAGPTRERLPEHHPASTTTPGRRHQPHSTQQQGPA